METKTAEVKYKGIIFKKREGKWRPQLYVKGKLIHGGLHIDPRAAALQYDKMCITYGKEPVNILKRKTTKNK